MIHYLSRHTNLPAKALLRYLKQCFIWGCVVYFGVYLYHYASRVREYSSNLENVGKEEVDHVRTENTHRSYKNSSRLIIENETRELFMAYGGFVNRSHGFDKVCIVLAGYRPFLYNYTLERLRIFMEPDIDVCIISSGRYDRSLAAICKSNGWSYLHTERNSICLVLNVAIHLHHKAKIIFKLDEDIFITQHYFSKMYAAFKHAKQIGEWNPGVIAPLINVNRYSSLLILRRFGCVNQYDERFQSRNKFPLFSVSTNLSACKFFWGESNGCLPHLDIMNAIASKLPMEERSCPIRFSIGAVMYERAVWEAMRYFSNLNTNAAPDENQLLTWCCLHNRPVVVSENIIVGHLCYQVHVPDMQSYLQEHSEFFDIIPDINETKLSLYSESRI